MNFLAQLKSKFTGNNLAHERGAGGYGSNPFLNLMNRVFGFFQNTRINYAQEVGDLTQSRLIMSAVNFFGRALPEAVLEIAKVSKDGTKKVDVFHPLIKLFRRPNKFYTGSNLLKGFALSWVCSGNVYFYKVRNNLGEVIELWYLPHYMVEPRWSIETSNNFIDYYAYQIDGAEYHLKPDDVIHFRNGIDPANTRLGLSPVASALREVFTDNEAANLSALLMKNSGVPPFAISPKDSTPNADKKDLARMEDSVLRKISGDERGKPWISTKAFDVHKIGFSPEELDISKLRRLPEETIASLLGIPAVVLQFGAGLERSTYSNYSEAREAAYEETIVPLWKYIAEEISHQLLPDFEKSEKLIAQFNLSEIRVLQDDMNKLYQRLSIAFRGDWMMKSEARDKAGLPFEDADKVYFSQIQKLNKEVENGKTEGDKEPEKEKVND